MRELAASLVTNLTGSQRGDAGFDSALKSFSDAVDPRRHRFLDTAKETVRRQVEGFRDKFVIQNRVEQAEALGALFAQFEARLPSGAGAGETDHHYDILSLIAFLASSSEPSALLSPVQAGSKGPKGKGRKKLKDGPSPFAGMRRLELQQLQQIQHASGGQAQCCSHSKH